AMGFGKPLLCMVFVDCCRLKFLSLEFLVLDAVLTVPLSQLRVPPTLELCAPLAIDMYL
ncbi:hypothetical protein BaRGS_00014003, partial [Batillaria attramentaria]